MTTLEIILIIILWIVFACILGYKWEKVDYLDGLGYFLLFLFMPLVLIGAIIRQVLIEPWK